MKHVFVEVEAGLTKIVWSVNKSWNHDSYFSLYRPIHPRGNVRGICPANTQLFDDLPMLCLIAAQTIRDMHLRWDSSDGRERSIYGRDFTRRRNQLWMDSWTPNDWLLITSLGCRPISPYISGSLAIADTTPDEHLQRARRVSFYSSLSEEYSEMNNATISYFN